MNYTDNRPKSAEGMQITTSPITLIYQDAKTGEEMAFTVRPVWADRRYYDMLAMRRGWPAIGSENAAYTLMTEVIAWRAAQRHKHLPAELKADDFDDFGEKLIDLIPEEEEEERPTQAEAP